MSCAIKKYPRTPHLEGSRLQEGDEDLSQIKFAQIEGRHVVVEEKIDGANCAVSFDGDGNLLLQSRGHYLVGGWREAHFDIFKQWANVHKDVFFEALGTRYIMYGEWMYAKHKVYYDMLPHYFVEFDIFDRQSGEFLDTPSRKKLTDRMPICSVAVLGEGVYKSVEDIVKLLGKSQYASDKKGEKLKEYCDSHNLDYDDVLISTDLTDKMEGLYIKVEEDGKVVDRLKYVRKNFAQIDTGNSADWLKRKIVPNLLAVDFESLFERKN